MAEQTKIQWTDHTFNPWIGCQKVSPGCKHCYAEVDTPARTSRGIGLELWGPPPLAQRRLTTEAVWTQPLRWHRQAKRDGRTHHVFCASQSDVFDEHDGQMVDHKTDPLWTFSPGTLLAALRPPTPDWTPYTLQRARHRLFQLIEATHRLTWQLLTKRPENMLAMVPTSWHDRWPPNVWAMSSLENQEYADRRIPHLLRVPARVRGLSVEPLLGPVDLHFSSSRYAGNPQAISWVLVGGESGPHARPCELEWVRSLVRQCQEARVACFVKQLGSNLRGLTDSKGLDHDRIANVLGSTYRLRDPKGGDPSEWPEDLRVREFPQ